ncbi:MAG: DUF2203 domain-containing protein [Polyangiaceae bacterium]
MRKPRVFSVAEVNALIPELSTIVKRQIDWQAQIEEGLADLAKTVGGLPRTLDEDNADSGPVAELKSELRRRIERYERGWRDVTELGAVVKDPDVGLVDFYGRVDGRLVWFCWRFGEETLRYYHELDAGFSARRPLRPEARLLN